MRGIPNTIATKQDVMNLCNDLSCIDAQIVLDANTGIVSSEEYLFLNQNITNRSYNETMRDNKAKRLQAQYNVSEIIIDSLRSEIDVIVNDIRLATKQKNKAWHKKQEFEIVMQHVRDLEYVPPIQKKEQGTEDWEIIEKHKDLFSEDERKKFMQILAAGKRKKKMDISGGRRMWAEYHSLNRTIAELRLRIKSKLLYVRGLMNTLASEKRNRLVVMESMGEENGKFDTI